MPEIRPAASLTSNLLARRGDARPAMRRQAVSHLHVPLAPQDDLGWNDIGEDEREPLSATPASLSAMTISNRSFHDEQDDDDGDDGYQPHGGMSPLSPITRHLEAIAQRITDVARDTSTSFKPMMAGQAFAKLQSQRAAPGLSGQKAAFTLRLDAERHLRLRLLSALVHRSSQQLLIEALDALLARHEKVEDLAGRIEEGSETYDQASGQ